MPRSAKALVLGLFAFVACGKDEPTAPGAGPSSSSSSSSSSTSSSSGGPGVVADAGGDDDDEPVLQPFKDYDINHVLSTGQSLSVGAQGAPALSTAQPFENLMFKAGVVAASTDLDSLVPLQEASVETMSSAFASLATQLANDDRKIKHVLLLSAHGQIGVQYEGLKKGTGPYGHGIAQAKAGMAAAKALGKTYVVRAVTNVHGETDHYLLSATYRQDIATWQSDYETEVKAITGQSEPIPMLHTQMASFTKLGNKTGNPSTTSTIPIDQLAVHVASNGKTVLVGPKYHLPYGPDGLHLTNEGYRQMGEEYAKVYRRIVLEGKKWEPLRPIAITRSGKTVTVKLLVPAPPLVLDTTAVTNPGGFGFEVAQDGGGAPSIQNVTVAGPDTITIELSAEPTGQNRRLRYAFTGTAQAGAGPQTGPRGNLRDSDATKSRHGYKLSNWCVHFDEVLP